MKLLLTVLVLFILPKAFAKDAPDSCYLNDTATVALKEKGKQLQVLSAPESGGTCEFIGKIEGKLRDGEAQFVKGKCRVTAIFTEQEINVQMDSSPEDCDCDTGVTLNVEKVVKADSKASNSCHVISFQPVGK